MVNSARVHSSQILVVKSITLHSSQGSNLPNVFLATDSKNHSTGTTCRHKYSCRVDFQSI